MTKLKWSKFFKWAEFYARIIVWAGAISFELSAVQEITSRDTTSPIFTGILWIFVVATCIVGLLDLSGKLNALRILNT